MFAAVVREGMFVRTPSGRLARVLWSTPNEKMGFFEIEYLDKEEKGTLHCRLMKHAALARQPEAGGVITGTVAGSLDE